MEIKFKNIEILRFFFILSIIACHIDLNIKKSTVLFFQNFANQTHWTWLAVDFFFIISGFFLFLKTDFNVNFVSFAKKKLKRLLPLVLIVLYITYIFSLFTPLTWLQHENLFTILNLQNVGLTTQNGNIPPSWFVSSLFWTSCFYFYLYKVINRNIFNLITASIIFACYSLFLHAPHDANLANIFYFINTGMVRAFGGMGIGYFIYLFYKEFYSSKTTFFNSFWSKLLISIIEIWAFITLFYYLDFHYTSYNNILYIILVFIILFICFIVKKGIISKFFDNDFSVFLGKYTYSIFLIHYLVKDLYVIYCNSYGLIHPKLYILILYIITILAGIILYHFVEKPIAKLFHSIKNNI